MAEEILQNIPDPTVLTHCRLEDTVMITNV